MTCSNSNKENAALPVNAGDASFQGHQWNTQSKPIDKTDIPEHQILHPIDSNMCVDLASITFDRDIFIDSDTLASAINPQPLAQQQPCVGEEEEGLLNHFHKLSVNESSNSHCNSCNDASRMMTENAGDNDATIAATATSEASRKAQETARNLLLFLGDEDADTQLHICIMQEDEVNAIHIINRAPDFTYLNIQNKLLQTPMHLAALTNSPKLVRKLICSGADIQSQDRDGNTALHLACGRGYLEVVKQLLKPVMYEETLENKHPIPYMAIPQNMNVKNYEGHTCLHLAVLSQNVDILCLLLEAGADPNIGDSKSGRTPLHVAAEQGLLDCVSVLIHYRRTEIDAMNYTRHTPALLAYSRGHVTIVQLLVRLGASYGFVHGGDDASSEDSEAETGMNVTI